MSNVTLRLLTINYAGTSQFLRCNELYMQITKTLWNRIGYVITTDDYSNESYNTGKFNNTNVKIQ